MPAFLFDLIDTLTERGRWLLRQKSDADLVAKDPLPAMGEMLISRRGEASGVALANSLLATYSAASEPDRLSFLLALAGRFGPDRRQTELAIEALRRSSDAGDLERLHAAAEPRRQELIRRLNQAPGGTWALVRMREDLLRYLQAHPELQCVDDDFAHLFSSWFNRGFLVLRPIDWMTPANILEKIIRYEAVHEIQNWDDLRNRVQPDDRRCYAFFHPQLIDEPLIFVEVALTREISATVAPLLEIDRAPIAATEATTAVFYSISNTQKGLAGVSFGNFLIKHVVEKLKHELPSLKTFVTLSPVPGFARWLDRERKSEASACQDDTSREVLGILDDPSWSETPENAEKIRAVILSAAAYYFLKAKDHKGRPLDPVARFHLGNGARLERLNVFGDTSPKGRKQSHGLMVNYLYDIADIEKNHEAFAERGTVAVSSAVRKMLRGNLPSRDLAPPSDMPPPVSN